MQEYLLRFLSLATKPFIHPKRNDAQVILSILCAVPSKLFVNTPLLYGKVPKLLTEVCFSLLKVLFLFAKT